MDAVSHESPPSSALAEPDLRRLAVKRLRDRRGLQAHTLAYVMLNIFLVAVWAGTGGGIFWPLFPLLGWGIGLGFNVWAVVSPEPTEERIRAEMQRIMERG